MTTETMMTDILTTEDGAFVFCEDCNLEYAIHEFVGTDDKVFKLCDKCNDEAWELADEQREAEEEEDRKRYEEEGDYRDDLGCCVSCRKEKAVLVFMHMYNGNFELCEKCFEWADHEDDYGKEFEKEKVTMPSFLLG